jgi:hypothetical protein
MAIKDWCLLPQTTYPKYWQPIDEIVGELDYDEWHEFEGGNDYNSKLESDLEERERKKRHKKWQGKLFNTRYC